MTFSRFLEINLFNPGEFLGNSTSDLGQETLKAFQNAVSYRKLSIIEILVRVSLKIHLFHLRIFKRLDRSDFKNLFQHIIKCYC